MPANANQNRVHINRDFNLNPGEFVSYDENPMWKAANILNHGVGFSLWLYFAGNSDGYEFDIFPTDVTKKTGMIKSSYYNAREDLVTYGYLIKNLDDSYGYEFYAETPVRQEWLDCISKTRSKRKIAEGESKLVDEYNRLIEEKNVKDFTLEEQWLYNRGQSYGWKKEWVF